MLTILLLQAGRVISTDRLIDEIWGDQPPQAAVATVHWYVMRIRRLLGDGLLVTRGRGYELVLEDDDLDAAIFERLVQSGQRHIGEGKLEAAIEALSEGLELWQGPVAADVRASPIVAAEIVRLDQLRLTALEARLGAQLDLGYHDDVVDELQVLAAEHPLRERLWEQLMLALYRCGRRAEALDVYQRVRRRLVDEVGLEPGQPLRELQGAILADDPRVGEPPARRGRAPAPEEVITPAQLPPDVPGFTGRDTYCAELDAQLPDERGLAVLVICTIGGTAGVGKTALAVHWAHRVADRFPDGQLHVNLRGYAASTPLRPMEVLARFLHALGVEPAKVPVDVEEAAALYRSLLAGKRVLVLLDNANSPEQIRPLLPSGGGSLVLVTSRDQLTGLVALDGAVRLTLDVLTPPEALALLTRLLGDREPEAQEGLAVVCGYLPLALRIAAANLLSRQETSVAEYTVTLAGDDRLSALQVAGDPQAAVRAAFDHSYAVLPEAAQRLFRLLGLVPGPQFDAPAAAALAGIPVATAATLLRELAGAYLLDGQAGDRYSCHDLLRHYAAERAAAIDSEDDRRAALDRLHNYYLGRVDAAARQLYPHVLRLASVAGDGFPDGAQASAWLETERPNLVAAVLHAAEHGHPEAAWRLADALRGYLYLRMYTVDWLQVASAGLAAAEREGDRQALAAAHIGLATLHWAQGKHQRAIAHFTSALTLARQAGWVEGESAAVGNLGNLHWALGNLDEAAEHFEKAQAHYSQVHQAAAQATALGNLGLVYFGQGRLDIAESHCTEALALHRSCGSRSGEVRTLTHLGDIQHALGRPDEALRSLTEALAKAREAGDRNIEGDTLRSLATVHRDAGRLPLALELASSAVELARETGDRRLESGTLTTRGTVHHRLGSAGRARDDHGEALRLARVIGDRYIEVEALIGLAAANPGDDEGLAVEALTIARERGYRLLEAWAQELP